MVTMSPSETFSASLNLTWAATSMIVFGWSPVPSAFGSIRIMHPWIPDTEHGNKLTGTRPPYSSFYSKITPFVGRS